MGELSWQARTRHGMMYRWARSVPSNASPLRGTNPNGDQGMENIGEVAKRVAEENVAELVGLGYTKPVALALTFTLKDLMLTSVAAEKHWPLVSGRAIAKNGARSFVAVSTALGMSKDVIEKAWRASTARLADLAAKEAAHLTGATKDDPILGLMKVLGIGADNVMRSDADQPHDDGMICDNPDCPEHGEEVRRRRGEKRGSKAASAQVRIAGIMMDPATDGEGLKDLGKAQETLKALGLLNLLPNKPVDPKDIN